MGPHQLKIITATDSLSLEVMKEELAGSVELVGFGFLFVILVGFFKFIVLMVIFLLYFKFEFFIFNNQSFVSL